MKNIVVGTGCYEYVKSGNTVSVTGDGGNAWGYFGPAYKKLSPSWKLYEYWRDNPDNLTDIELIKYYIENYFNHRLANLNTRELLYSLKEKFGEEIIFLCHELPNQSREITKEHFCHRRLDADYIELETGIVIPEVIVDKFGNKVEVQQPDYKPFLRKLMK